MLARPSTRTNVGQGPMEFQSLPKRATRKKKNAPVRQTHRKINKFRKKHPLVHPKKQTLLRRCIFAYRKRAEENEAYRRRLREELEAKAAKTGDRLSPAGLSVKIEGVDASSIPVKQKEKEVDKQALKDHLADLLKGYQAKKHKLFVQLKQVCSVEARKKEIEAAAEAKIRAEEERRLKLAEAQKLEEDYKRRQENLKSRAGLTRTVSSESATTGQTGQGWRTTTVGSYPAASPKPSILTPSISQQQAHRPRMNYKTNRSRFSQPPSPLASPMTSPRPSPPLASKYSSSYRPRDHGYMRPPHHGGHFQNKPMMESKFSRGPSFSPGQRPSPSPSYGYRSPASGPRQYQQGAFSGGSANRPRPGMYEYNDRRAMQLPPQQPRYMQGNAPPRGNQPSRFGSYRGRRKQH